MRALLLLFGVGILAALVLLVVDANPGTVTLRLPFFLPMQVELWRVILGGVGAGAALALGLELSGRTRRALRRRRMRGVRAAFEEGERQFLRGLEQMASARWADALRTLGSAQEGTGADARILMRKAECLMRLGRPADAVRELEEAVREDRSHRGAAYALVEAEVALGHTESARVLLETTIAEDPNPSPAALAQLRDLLVDAGDAHAALGVQQRLMRAAPEEQHQAEERRALALRHADGVALLEAGEAVEAVRVFRKVLEEAPGAAPAWLRLGEAYHKAKNENAAIETWKRGFDETSSTAILVALQDAYLERTRPEEAISVWKQAIQGSGGAVAAECRYQLGKLYDRLFMLDEALQCFAQVSEQVSEPPAGERSPALNARMARLLESRGDLPEAVERARDAMAALPDLLREYVCSACGARSATWLDICAKCKGYGTVDLDVPVAKPVASSSPAPVRV